MVRLGERDAEGCWSAVPSALEQVKSQSPNIEMLGYYRESLRDLGVWTAETRFIDSSCGDATGAPEGESVKTLRTCGGVRGHRAEAPVLMRAG